MAALLVRAALHKRAPEIKEARRRYNASWPPTV
jgi:hypothetical protein